MKAPREEEEGGIIAQGAHDVNGILSGQAADVLSASIFRRSAIKEGVQNNLLWKAIISGVVKIRGSTETEFYERKPSTIGKASLFGKGVTACSREPLAVAVS